MIKGFKVVLPGDNIKKKVLRLPNFILRKVWVTEDHLVKHMGICERLF